MKQMLSILGATALMTVASFGGAKAQEYTLQFGHYLANGPFLDVEKEFIDNVEKATDGRVKFNLAYAGGLGAGDELLGLAGRGAVDMAALVPGYYANQLLFAKALQIPFVFNSPAQAIEVAQTSFKEIPAFQEEMDKLRIHYLFTQPLGSYYLTGKTDDCKTLDGLKGKKIRTFGSDIPKIMTAVGAVPVSVPVSDLYEALERGTLDYSFLNLGNIEAYRLQEVGKYSCGPVQSIAGHIVVMSKRTWDGLPEDIQTVFTQEAEKAQKRYVEWIVKADETSEANIKKAGGEIIDYTPEQIAKWKEASPDLLQSWVDDMKSRGEGDAAQEVADKWREMTSK
mgnify:CR=1 FL=1|tara:strand:- start:410 stop:1426 length:1017 start_codon:yes stop_codon:yes gene_type:complete